jgi:uncharacterized protein YegL
MSIERVYPIYLACDVSMGREHLAAITAELTDLRLNPAVTDVFWLGIIAYSETVVVLNRLAPIEDALNSSQTRLPTSRRRIFRPRAIAYAPLFDSLRMTIEEDIAALGAVGQRIYRPTLFILAATKPKDTREWRSRHDELMSKTWHPNVVAVGLDGVSANELKGMATVLAACASEAAPLGELIVDYALDHFRTKATRGVVAIPRVPGLEVIWTAP